jgi:transcriptional regulator with XRE-family HTH domain
VSADYVELIAAYGASPGLLRRLNEVATGTTSFAAGLAEGEAEAAQSHRVADDTEPAGFGGVLRKFRRDAGLSQQALAERAGLSVDAIAALERGRRRAPRTRTLRLLADALRLEHQERALLIAAAAGEDDTPGDRATSYLAGEHYRSLQTRGGRPANVSRRLALAQFISGVDPTHLEWSHREESMKMLRWAVERILDGDEVGTDVGMVTLRALMTSDSLEKEDYDLIAALTAVVAADRSARSADAKTDDAHADVDETGGDESASVAADQGGTGPKHP